MNQMDILPNILFNYPNLKFNIVLVLEIMMPSSNISREGGNLSILWTEP